MKISSQNTGAISGTIKFLLNRPDVADRDTTTRILELLSNQKKRVSADEARVLSETAYEWVRALHNRGDITPELYERRVVTPYVLPQFDAVYENRAGEAAKFLAALNCLVDRMERIITPPAVEEKTAPVKEFVRAPPPEVNAWAKRMSPSLEPLQNGVPSSEPDSGSESEPGSKSDPDEGFTAVTVRSARRARKKATELLQSNETQLPWELLFALNKANGYTLYRGRWSGTLAPSVFKRACLTFRRELTTACSQFLDTRAQVKRAVEKTAEELGIAEYLE